MLASGGGGGERDSGRAAAVLLRRSGLRGGMTGGFVCWAVCCCGVRGVGAIGSWSGRSACAGTGLRVVGDATRAALLLMEGEDRATSVVLLFALSGMSTRLRLSSPASAGSVGG